MQLSKFIDNDKKLLLVLLLVIALILVPFLNTSSLKKTQDQLKFLIAKGFDNSEIEKVISAKYPGTGDYNLFKVRGEPTYFPILLDIKEKHSKYESFTSGKLISKKQNSHLIRLENEDVEIIKLRNPKDEFDNLDILIPFILVLLLLSLQTVLKKPLFSYFFDVQIKRIK